MDWFVLRPVLVLVAVPAAALGFISMAKLKVRTDERRVEDYVRRVQPQLALDPRFKYVDLRGHYAWGCVSNSEAFRSLGEFIEASKPPFPVSLNVSTNETEWRRREQEAHYWELAHKGSALVEKADAYVEAHSDAVQFIVPEATNFVRTLPEFEAALRTVQHRSLAVISYQGFGFTALTNEVAEATAILKQCGFTDVRHVVIIQGSRFPADP